MNKGLAISIGSSMLAAAELVLAYLIWGHASEVRATLEQVEGITPHYLAMFRAFAWLHLGASLLMAVVFAIREYANR